MQEPPLPTARGGEMRRATSALVEIRRALVWVPPGDPVPEQRPSNMSRRRDMLNGASVKGVSYVK